MSLLRQLAWHSELMLVQDSELAPVTPSPHALHELVGPVQFLHHGRASLDETPPTHLKLVFQWSAARRRGVS